MRAMRVLAAAGVLASAAIHLRLWLDGFRDQHMIGPAFMLNAIAGAVIGVLLLTWQHWVPAFLAVGFGVATLGAFVISATVGLYGVHEVWRGSYVLGAAAAEVVAILAGGAVLLQDNPLRSTTRSTGGSAGQLEHRLTLRRPHFH